MIRVEQLSCALSGRRVLRDVSLHAPKGAVLGLLGPNGSGKTTLLLALAGVVPALSGRVFLNGTDVSNLSPAQRARLAASVPQSRERPPSLSGLDMVLMGRYPHLPWFANYSAQDRELARQALDRMGAADLAPRRVDELSGGERQKIFLARALAQGCPALLLDEPTTALDAASSLRFLDLVRDLADGGGAAVCALHDLNLAGLYCDRLVFLDQGRVVLSGPTRDVFTGDSLSRVYGVRVVVERHPVLDVMQAFFVPGSGTG